MKNSIFLILLLVSFLYSCERTEEIPNTAPSIEALTYSIEENSESGTIVGELMVRDEDVNDKIRVEIIDGNTDNAFSIDSINYKILVVNPNPIDYEVNNEFNLVVRAEDSRGAFDETPFTVTVIDKYEVIKDNLVAYYPFPGDYQDYSSNDFNANDFGDLYFVEGLVKNPPDLGNLRLYNKSSNQRNQFTNMVNLDALLFMDQSVEKKFNYLTIPNSLNRTEFTIGYWFKMDTIKNHHSFLMLNRTNEWMHSDFWLFSAEGRIAVLQNYQDTRRENYTINSSFSTAFLESSVLLPGKIYFLVCTYTNSTFTIYLDDSVYSTYDNISPYDSFIDDTNLLIGVCPNPNDPVGKYAYQFDGVLDELVIYNRALSEEEIQSMYQDGIN